MSHDRGCWKCGRDQWDYDNCRDSDCAKREIAFASVSNHKPRVFVVQQQLHRNPNGVLVPKFDLTPASKFGELVYVLKTDDLPTEGQAVLNRIRSGLCTIREQDYILPIGSTILMVLVGIVAAEYVGKVNFLYWHGKDRQYRPTSFSLDD